MAALIDTSVWVDVLRDTSGGAANRVRSLVADDDVVLTRFNQLELLQGAADEREWAMLADFLEGQDYVEASGGTWRDAARIYFDLRRQGRTVRSPIDCCIAQLAIENNLRLLHNDRDFEIISEVRPLVARRIAEREG